MDLRSEPDGGATIRLSRLELVGYYNHLSRFLSEGETWSDGSPIPDEVLRPLRLQLHQLSVAIGRDDIAHPDALLPLGPSGDARADCAPADMLSYLQDWYAACCDGDWEHRYGLEIGTLDNPGWRVSVDLTGTTAEGVRLDRHVAGRTEDDWLQVWVEDGVFHAACGPHNLHDALQAFRSLLQSAV